MGSGLIEVADFQVMNPEIHQSYTRLRALKQNENLMQEQIKKGIDIGGQNPVKLQISELMAKEVPPNWNQFLDDVNAELSQVTSEVYDGGVSKGLKHGQGQMILPSGDIYKGHWKNDLRHGSGICKFANGAIYKGEWREGRPMGQGILYSAPNEIIETRFEGWKLADGNGPVLVKILLTNGEYYEGAMKDEKREGQGKMFYSNGDTFQGEFFKDKRVKRGKIH